MTNKILQAIFLTLVLCMSLFLFYPSNSELGKSFVVSSIYMMLSYATLVVGIILLLVRLFLFRQLSSKFIYIFLTTLNIAVCLSALTLFVLHHANREWLHDCLLNGLVGAGMLGIAMIVTPKT